MANKFKYQSFIDQLIEKGCVLPPLFEPNNIMASRFVFSSIGSQNHIPQYISNPKRMLNDINKGTSSTSLLSLSCFLTSLQAESFFLNLRKAFKNISLSIGDSLAEGILTNEDGLRTINSQNGHFDFYEFENCDLNKSFNIKKKL